MMTSATIIWIWVIWPTLWSAIAKRGITARLLSTWWRCAWISSRYGTCDDNFPFRLSSISMQVSVYLRHWSHVSTYANKADSTDEYSDKDKESHLVVRTKLRYVCGLSRDVTILTGICLRLWVCDLWNVGWICAIICVIFDIILRRLGLVLDGES